MLRARIFTHLTYPLLLLCFSVVANASSYQEKVARSLEALGQPVDPFEFTDSNGAYVNFSSLKGQTTIAYFFASWCTPCYATLENLEEERKMANKSTTIVAVSFDSDPEKLKRMLIKTGYTGEVWLSTSKEKPLLNKLFANFSGSLPYAIKVDANGILIEHSHDIKSKEQWSKAISGELSLQDAGAFRQ